MFLRVCMRASKVLHDRMFGAMLTTPMRFFDMNPSGRILNRFSKDMGAIDEIMPRIMLDAVQIILVMCGILITVMIVNPYMIVALLASVILFAAIVKLYMRPSQDLKRLEGICKCSGFTCPRQCFMGKLCSNRCLFELELAGMGEGGVLTRILPNSFLLHNFVPLTVQLFITRPSWVTLIVCLFSLYSIHDMLPLHLSHTAYRSKSSFFPSDRHAQRPEHDPRPQHSNRADSRVRFAARRAQRRMAIGHVIKYGLWTLDGLCEHRLCGVRHI